MNEEYEKAVQVLRDAGCPLEEWESLADRLKSYIAAMTYLQYQEKV